LFAQTLRLQPHDFLQSLAQFLAVGGALVGLGVGKSDGVVLGKVLGIVVGLVVGNFRGTGILLGTAVGKEIGVAVGFATGVAIGGLIKGHVWGLQAPQACGKFCAVCKQKSFSVTAGLTSRYASISVRHVTVSPIEGSNRTFFKTLVVQVLQPQFVIGQYLLFGPRYVLKIASIF
jgi:hypothetical protein